METTVKAKNISLKTSNKIETTGILSHGNNRILKTNKRMINLIGEMRTSFLDMNQYGLENCIMAYGEEIVSGTYYLELEDKNIYGNVLFFGKSDQFLTDFPVEAIEDLNKFISNHIKMKKDE
ncbi:hypothetical protein DH09_08085 [Bacillaceae bacterium JMAK1]|nr:hypothetical protein DH09_08085 [Bacillaceae bacterium JMAK1]